MIDDLRTSGVGEFRESVGSIDDPNPRLEARRDPVNVSSNGTSPVETCDWVL